MEDKEKVEVYNYLSKDQQFFVMDGYCIYEGICQQKWVHSPCMVPTVDKYEITGSAQDSKSKAHTVSEVKVVTKQYLSTIHNILGDVAQKDYCSYFLLEMEGKDDEGGQDHV